MKRNCNIWACQTPAKYHGIRINCAPLFELSSRKISFRVSFAAALPTATGREIPQIIFASVVNVNQNVPLRWIFFSFFLIFHVVLARKTADEKLSTFVIIAISFVRLSENTFYDANSLTIKCCLLFFSSVFFFLSEKFSRFNFRWKSMPAAFHLNFHYMLVCVLVL